MRNNEYMFKLILRAFSGNDKAKWKLVEQFDKYIGEVSKGDPDLRQTLILSLYESIDDIKDDFYEYVNKII